MPSRLQEAELARQFARSLVTKKGRTANPLEYGSDNKFNLDDLANPSGQRERNKKLTAVRAATPAAGGSNSSLADYAERVDNMKAAGVGNCHDLSVAAYYFLAKLKSDPVDLVALDHKTGGDHVFVIYGRSETTKLDTPLDQWPETVLVCDPWANFVCPVKDYHAEWQKKMQKWNDHKAVAYQGKFISPTRGDWISAINKHALVLLNRHVPPAAGKLDKLKASAERFGMFFKGLTLDTSAPLTVQKIH